jgi:putative phosphoesterase
VKLGVVSDIHGNKVALDAVLADSAAVGIKRWWALGDLVLSGSRPVEVVETLRALPEVAFVGGNTDRYVVTGAQPPAHPTVADVVGDADLVRRYSEVAASIGWAQGALAQAGLLDWLADLPSEQRMSLPDGTTMLAVHASPGSDDGQGISPDVDDDLLAALLGDCHAELVIGGHTHRVTDRRLDGIRVLNPGSVGLPFRGPGCASWMVIDADASGVRVEHRLTPFDVDAAVADLRARRHPGADFVESILRGTHRFAN